MPWLVRTGYRYYYRSRKVLGRGITTYVGAGDVADQAAAEDARRRAERQARRTARRAEEVYHDAADASVHALSAPSDTLFRAVLLTSDYRQHSRGPWRKRRVHPDPPAAT